ncbi:hypothetical protein BS47DRAFT_1367896 [Hydnum rufescens UP504]|uniref:Uncharacterized protein n=1 Tax=Hydnum rufescens UP504 TaxID=1448309 RepID=A0A9P6DNX0_9AGAM|nr:hypothetical protein BS47DRAFT_1367896 [Hydnum rufescens UP504]
MHDPHDHGYRNHTGGPQSLPHPRGLSSTSYWPAPHPSCFNFREALWAFDACCTERESAHWCQNFLPVIVRGREVLKGRGIISGKVVLLGIGVFKVMVVLCLCILLAGVMDLGPVQLQQVAAQATPYDPVIIGHLLNALSGPTPNVLMPQPQVAVSGMLYSPIPVGRWAIISLGPVPEGFQTPDVWLALYPQVIAACTECKKGKVSIQLLFKWSRPCNELKVTLEGWAATHAAEVMTVTIDASHALSERYTGLRDLEYIDQVYAHARSQQELDNLLAIAPPLIKDKDSRSQYGEYFLNYDQYLPIVVIEFDTAWLVAGSPNCPSKLLIFIFIEWR